MSANIKTFLSDVTAELKKASWPWDPKEKGMKKYKQLIDSTLIVVIGMLLLSGYIAGLDFIMTLMTKALVPGSLLGPH